MDADSSSNQILVKFSPILNQSFPFSSLTERDYARVNDSDLNIPDFWTLVTSDNLRESLGWSIALILAYVIEFIIGAVGNILVILVMIFKPPMRAVTSMFIINLAVADLLVIVFCVPANLLANLYTPWILGSLMCKGVAYVQGVSVCASAYSLAALSLDRCKAIFRPMQRHQGISKNQALLTILLIWIFSVLIASPWLLVFEVEKSEDDGHVYCLEVWSNELMGNAYFLVANLMFCYAIPLMIICISNVAIWCHVSKREVPEDSVSVRRIHKKTRNSVRKTLSTVTSAFLISWLPLYVLATIVKFSSVKNIKEWEGSVVYILLPFAQWLGSLNSSMNPVLYAFINSKFRKGLRSLFTSWASKDDMGTKRRIYCRKRSQTMFRRQNAPPQRSVAPAHNATEVGNKSNGSIDASPQTDV